MFALIDFVAAGQAAAALREVDALLESGRAPPMILGLIRTGGGQAAAGREGAAGARPRCSTPTWRSSRRAGEPRHVLERLVVELCGNVLERPPLGR